MSNLFNLSEEYIQLMYAIEEAEGELTPELEYLLEVNQQEVEQKLKAYHYIIKQLEGEQKVLDDEIDRLKLKKQTKENAIKRLKDSTLVALQLFGVKTDKGNYKLKYDNLSIWSVGTESVNVIDENAVPDTFKTVSIKTKLSLNALKIIMPIIHKEHFPNMSYNEFVDMFLANEIYMNIDKKAIKDSYDEEQPIAGAELIKGAYVRFK
jgi:hypothetical protein